MASFVCSLSLTIQYHLETGHHHLLSLSMLSYVLYTTIETSMVFFVDIMHGRGLSNKMLPWLQRLRYVRLALYTLHITNKAEHFSFKSGCVVRVAKCLKEDWFIGLWWQLQLCITKKFCC